MRTKFFFLCIMFCMLFTLSKAQYQVSAYKVTSLQPSQPGAEVGNCIDNNDATGYHSKWSTLGIPDQLDFYFVDIPSVNKIEYTPRPTGTNGIWTKIDVYFSTQDNPNTFNKLYSQLTWALDNTKKSIDLSTTPIDKPYIIRIYITAGGGNYSSCNEMRFYSSQQPPVYSIDDCTPPTDDLSSTDNNVPVIVAGTSASSQETINEDDSIGMSFDGDTSTIYHSEWEPTTNVFPITLNYHFDGTKPIDYLRYTPRQDGNNNGFFGKISIFYNTNSDATFIPLVDYDFGMNGAITDVHFPSTIIPANIKILVINGMNNFASCAEMEFYPKASSTALPYGDIFADSVYSELKPNVTLSTIDGITDPFYKALAQCIFNKTYNKKYRVKSYEVYPTLNTTKNALKTSTYDAFENTTGIVFVANTKIVLFVDSTPSSIFLKVHDFANEANATDKVYPLKAGLNVIDSKTIGLGYISYYSDDNTLPPVKINIVSGTLNGYYDTATSTPDEWKLLLLNKAYTKLDLRGKYIHLVYDKNALRTNSPDNPVELINTYDNIIRQQRILMGLFKYGKSPKNHQFAFTESEGGWYAGGLGAHFDLTWGSANATSVSNMDYWGVGHELGHVNQIRPNLKWVGLGEVSNNVYSAWNEYTMGNTVPRLEREEFQTTDNGAYLAGGKLNKSVNYTVIGKNNLLQSFADNVYDHHFLIFPPFWQLELYYQVAGAAKGGLSLTDEENPVTNKTGIDYAHWYGYVAEKSRNTDATSLTSGQLSMEFVKNTCEAVQEDLTDFFIKSGFLRPINANIDDYGVQNITVTQEMIDATIAEIKSKNYSNPASPVINYINAQNVKVFRDKLPLSGTTGSGVILLSTSTGPQLKVDQVSVWKNVVAYEVYDTTGALARISLAGVGDTTNNSTLIEYPSGSDKVYAIGYDGSKILVYPNALATSEVNKENELTIYPNPAKSSDVIKLKLINSIGNYKMTVYSLSGSLVFQYQGGIKALNDKINNKFSTLNSGVYLVSVKDEKGQVYNTKLIKN